MGIVLQISQAVVAIFTEIAGIRGDEEGVFQKPRDTHCGEQVHVLLGEKELVSGGAAACGGNFGDVALQRGPFFHGSFQKLGQIHLGD